MSLQAVFYMTRWRRDVMTVGWMRQHCPSKICLCAASIVMEVEHLTHFSCRMDLTKARIQTSYCFNSVESIQCCPPRHCGASTTTSRFVITCCWSCFSFFNPSFPFLNSTNIGSSFTIHSWVNVCECKLASHVQQPTASCTNKMSNSAILQSTLVLPSV